MFLHAWARAVILHSNVMKMEVKKLKDLHSPIRTVVFMICAMEKNRESITVAGGNFDISVSLFSPRHEKDIHSCDR
jgi:hypothetical protein